MKKLLLLITMLVVWTSNVFAQTTLTLQPNGATGNDAPIFSIYPNQASPTADELDALAWTVGGTPFAMRGLVSFDFTSIPLGAIIQSATLTLFNDSNAMNGNNGQQISLTSSNAALLQRITGAWDQNTLTWNNQPTTTIIDELSLPPSTSVHQNYIMDVTTLVQDMIDNPATSFGFMIRLQTEQYYAALNFGTSDNPDSTIHPKLTITYIKGCTNLVLQPNGATGNDAPIFSIYPNQASPTADELDALAWTVGGTPFAMRGLVSFDFTSIPLGAIIQSATLTLFNDSNAMNGNNGQQISLTSSNAAWLQRITSPWNQNTLTWNNQPTTTIIDELSLPPSTSVHENYLMDVTTLVQDMIDSPATSFGFMIRLQVEQYYAALNFGTSNNPDSTIHPKLEICYISNVGLHQFASSPFEVNIYPNPASDLLNIHTTEIHQNAEIAVSILNTLGEIIKEDKLSWSNDINVNIKNLSAGIYFLEMKTENGRVVKKFVKQ